MKLVTTTHIITVIYECPYCGYPIEHPDTGKIDWTIEDIQSALNHFVGEGIKKGCVVCSFCDKPVKIDENVR